MAQARITYWADWDYVDKQLKEFTLTQEVIEKLDSIEPGAERNFIQWIKVNWEPQTPDEFRVVDINVPEVENSLTSTDIRKALSAKQGKVLMDYIKNLQALWHFLSNWNATTGMPTTNPQEIPYTYNAWDYYIISIVWDTNYRPEGSVYTWSASSTLETEELNVWDLYMYDGTEWLFLLNNERKIPIDISLSTTSTNPVENRVVTNALNTKQGTLTAWNNIQLNWNVISATDTTYDNLPASQGWVDESLVTTWDKYNWDNKQNTLQAWTNIQITWNTISATDTVYWAWANIQINNNIISATDTTYTASDFDIKDLSDSTNKRTYWDNKQEKIIAWNNVTIDADWKTINAIDTTYTASDFDIKDLSDSTDKRTYWDNKQEKIIAWTNITIWTDGKTINATDTTYTAWANVSIDVNNVISAVDTTYTAWTGIDITNWVISNTQTSAEWWNIQWDIADQTDLQTALNAKQNILTAWSNIQISWDTISATDTTYTAQDFDIKDLADSTSLRDTWSWKQNTISDLATIRSWAALGATALQSWDNISELINDAWYITSASLPTVNDWTLTIQKNGTTVATFTANQAWISTANLVIPTAAADVNALPDTTKYWANLDLSLNSTDYKITITLKDQDWNTLGTAKTIDLPIESVVVSWSYDSATKEVVLTLQWGSTIRFSVADLVAWLQTEITSTNKLDADLVDDTSSTHKFVTSAEKTTWNNKQNALTAWSNITISGNTISATDTTYTRWTATQGWTTLSLVNTWDMYTWNNKQNALTAWANINIDSNNVISATDTTYTAWTWINISWTTISNTWVTSVNWNTWVVTVTEANDSTITYTQAWDTIGSTTTNQASASTVAFRWDVFVTQAEYTALPSTKLTDGNTYLIYE